MLNLAAARTLKLSPSPHEGQRVAVADAGANLATYNLTLDGNGRTIEGAATQVLATDGMVRQWLYRGDTANWVRLTDLALDDDLPFPTEFDDYFAILLAMRLNPRHGRTLMEESAAWFTGREGAFEARYRRPRPVQDWGTPGLHGQFGRAYGSSATWTRGRGW